METPIKWHRIGQFFHVEVLDPRCSTDVPEKVAAEACPETLQAESVPFHSPQADSGRSKWGPELRT